MEYSFSLAEPDYSALRAAVGWEALPEKQAQAGLDGSFRRISCREGGRVAGCARLMWDGGYIAYIADVMVAPEFQGKGIGKTMVEALTGALADAKPDEWRVKVVLLAAKGKEGFYRRLGFCERPNEENGAGMEKWL